MKMKMKTRTLGLIIVLLSALGLLASLLLWNNVRKVDPTDPNASNCANRCIDSIQNPSIVGFLSMASGCFVLLVIGYAVMQR